MLETEYYRLRFINNKIQNIKINHIEHKHTLLKTHKTKQRQSCSKNIEGLMNATSKRLKFPIILTTMNKN